LKFFLPISVKKPNLVGSDSSTKKGDIPLFGDLKPPADILGEIPLKVAWF